MKTLAHALAASRRYITEEDVDDIQGLVEQLPFIREVNVLDLGAGSGTTALAVFCARRLGISVLSVDKSQEALDWAWLNLKALPDVENLDWRGVNCQVQDLVGWEHTIDLLLHDAGHSYEDVKEDLELLLPMMKPGSMIWVHDYKPMVGAAEEYPGVAKALEAFSNLLEPLPTTGIGFAARLR